MKMVLRTLLVAFVAALGGVLAGHMFLDQRHPPRHDIHAFIHERLDLDADQKQKLEEIERQFAARRAALEEELRADNALLAEAIAAEKGAGPRVNAAVDRCHEAMGRLQKATLAHVFAMRQLLRPDQAQKFDREVVKALTEEHRER
jgi:Spy/CpxP family protein refolding chaperone